VPSTANVVVTDERERPGPLAPEKIGESGEGRPEPAAVEVESARLFANSARERLRQQGMEDQDIQRAADAYIALDLGEDTDDFISWATESPRGESPRG
jgi:hypothetical protein